MEERRRKRGRILLFAVLILMIAAIAAAGLIFLQKQENSAGSGPSILSAKVEAGSIRKTLSGTGTLTEQDAQEVTVPTGVKVTDYLVQNGQIVKTGDPVAAVNRASVMEAIASLRDVMEAVADDIDEIQSTSLTTTVTAAATGRVKAIYAAEGEQVHDVLLRDGALAILSLDGLMAAEIPLQTSLGIGETVLVTLSDGTEVSGRVERVQEGVATVTIDDEYGSPEETVQVRTTDNRAAGSGVLYVHSAWKVFAADGLIYGAYLYEGQMAEAGVVLFRVDLPGQGSGYESFAAEHREYEKVLIQLFQMYDSGLITAPCDGYVSGVDEGILKLLSSDGREAHLQFLSYEAEEVTAGRVGMVTGVNSDGSISALMQNWDTDILSYLQTGSVETSADTMTQNYSTSYPIAFQWDGSQWQRKSVEVGDVYLFLGGNSESAMMAYVGHNNYSASADKNSSDESESSGNSKSDSKDGTDKESEDSDKQDKESSESDKNKTSGSGGKSGSGTSSASGNAAGASGSTEAQVSMRYDTEGTVILSITPQESVSVTITVDELDILSVRKGQEATVTLDALPGRSFTGAITEVDTTAANEGGNTKYSATVQMEKEGMMLGGMNASVGIIIDSRENVLLIPSEALTERNGKAAVYTGYNERSGELTGLVEVETGLSDGIQVEILTGLKEGDTVWYSYYDKLEIAGLTA